jgi:PAS domain S-box-containing protein
MDSSQENQKIEALIEVGKRLSAGIRLSEQEIFELIYQQASEKLGMKNLSIALYDENTDTVRFVLASVQNKRVDVEREAGWEPRKGCKEEYRKTEKIIRSRKYLLLSTQAEVEKTEFSTIPGHKNFKDRIPNSWLGVPMMFGDKVLGVIVNYDYGKDYLYSENDVEILQALADQAAIAIANARQIDAVYKISQTAHTTKNLYDLYPKIHNIIKGLISVENFRIVTFDSDNKVSKVLYYIDKYDDNEQIQRLVSEKGLASYVFKTKKALISNQEVRKNLINKGEIIDIGTQSKSWLGVPLKVQDRTFGVLAVYNYEDENKFGEAEKDILIFVSEQIAMAIDRVRTNHRKEVLINLAQKLTSAFQLNEDGISRLIYENATELMDTNNMYIALYDEKTDVVRFSLVYVNGRSINVKEGEEEEGYEPRSKGKGKTESIIRDKQPLFHATQADSDAWYTQSDHREYTGKARPSWMGVPMIANNDRVLGIVATYHPYKENVYTKDDLEILQAIADIAAIALNNAKAIYELEKQRTELLTLINNLPDHIYFKDRESRFLIVNDKVVRASGVASKEELLGKTDFDIQPKEKAEQYYSDERNIFDTGVPLINREEPYLNRETNSEGWLLSSKIPLRDEQNKIIGLVGINRDITERKKRETLQDSLYKISEAAHSAHNLEALYPRIHKIVSELMPANNFYIALHDSVRDTFDLPYFKDESRKEKLPEDRIFQKGLSGYVFRNREPLIGNPEIFERLIQDRKIEWIVKPSESWLGVPLKTQGKTIGVLAVQSYTKDVRYGEVEKDILMFVSEQIAMAIRLVKDRTKKLTTLIGLAQRVTSAIQLKKEQILQLIYENATELMDTSNMYIALYDNISDEVQFHLAYKEKTPLQVKTRKFGHGRTEEIIHTKNPIFIQTREESENWYKQPGRSEYMGDPLASWIGVPMMIGKKVIGVVATYHPTKDYVYTKDDLEILQAMANIAAIAIYNSRLYSEVEEKNNRLILAVGKIAEAESVLTRATIAADLVHRLNNLTGTIPIWADLLKENTDKMIGRIKQDMNDLISRMNITSTIPNWANQLQENTDKMIDKINKDVEKLIDVAGKLDEAPQEELIDISSVLNPILNQIRIQHRKKIDVGQFIVTEEISPDLYKIIGLSLSLSNAIFNIISNGIESVLSQQAGMLTVKACNYKDNENSEWVKIEIRDTGKGIPDDIRDKIFMPFFTTKEAGRGYGLWRAKFVIDNLGGNIGAESKYGEGATFTILLPKAKEN